MTKVKVTARFGFESSSYDGAVFKVEGVRGEDGIDLKIEVPGTGCGPSETPDRSATVRIPLDDWNEIVALVARATAPEGSPQR